MRHKYSKNHTLWLSEDVNCSMQRPDSTVWDSTCCYRRESDFVKVDHCINQYRPGLGDMIECQMNPRELDANLSFNYLSTCKLVISLMLQHPKSFQ